MAVFGLGVEFLLEVRVSPSVMLCNNTSRGTFKMRCLPEELAESLVVSDGFVVVLSEAVLDVFETPLLHQLAGRLGLLGKYGWESSLSIS